MAATTTTTQIIAVTFSLLMTLAGPLRANTDVHGTGHYTDMITPNGAADWTIGTVTARGIGIPPKTSVNALQSREMTRTAAWSVALRNLLEAVNGIYVDSTTTVNNYVTTNEDIRTRVEGMVKRARVVREQELPDGSFEIKVEMNLADFSKAVSPKTTPKTEPIKFEGAPAPPKASGIHTGLVIDARGTGAKPAIAPRVLTMRGEEAYSTSYVEKPADGARDESEKSRIAWYVAAEAAARTHPKVAHNPLMIKALRAEGDNRTDLVIHDADAQLIHLVPGNFQFLKQARVMIILDSTE